MAANDDGSVGVVNQFPLILKERDLITEEGELGQGSFGKVEKGILHGTKVAIKSPYFKGSRLQNTKQWWQNKVKEYEMELKMLHQLPKHPNICSVLGAVFPADDDENPKMRIVMELLDGDLEHIILGKLVDRSDKNVVSQWLKDYRSDHGPNARIPPVMRLPIADEYRDIPLFDRLDWAFQAAKGLAFLHKSNPPVVHRDLKMGNIFYKGQYGVQNNMKIQVGDFGLARFKGTAKGAAGTFVYVAPEALKGERGTASDIYTFGLLLWEFVMRKDVFLDVDDNVFKNTVKRDGFREPLPQRSQLLEDAGYCQNHAPGKDAKWPQKLQQLITECWSQEPGDRPKAVEVVKSLQEILEEIALPDPEVRQFWRKHNPSHYNDSFIQYKEKCDKFVDEFLQYASASTDSKRKIIHSVFVERFRTMSNRYIPVVRMSTFGRIITAFGPLHNNQKSTDEFFERLTAAKRETYFRGIMTTDDATTELEFKKPGSNLIRLSNTRYGCFVLSYVDKNEHVKHRLIHHDPTATDKPFSYFTKPVRLESLQAVYDAYVPKIAEDSDDDGEGYGPDDGGFDFDFD